MSNDLVHLIFMGVAGSGKTTAADALAKRLGWPEAEADDFHPQANIDKMSAGHPLTDEDRWPWLQKMRNWMTEHALAGSSTIVTCSALKRSYRDLLRQGPGRVFFVHLHAPADVLSKRIATREHFMKPGMLASQFETLQELGEDEDGLAISVLGSKEETLQSVIAALRERSLLETTF